MPLTHHIRNYGCLFGCLLLLTGALLAQSRQDLTAKREGLLKEINRASALLKSTRSNRKVALDQYYVVQRQVRQRQQLIETLKQEIDLANQSIERTTAAIRAMQADMERLEGEYAAMARQAFRQSQTMNEWLFLLSARGLSDGLRRWRYIRQYDNYRKRQANLIVETRNALAKKLDGIEIKKAEQQDLLTSAEEQQGLLRQELRIKNKLLNGLKKDETRISRLINRKRLAANKLSKAIETVIANEIRSRVDNNRVNTAPTRPTETRPSLKPSAPSANDLAANTTDFRQLKGRLQWPVQRGVIIRHFGKQNHPIHKNLKVTNNGIDIRATLNNKVQAIARGKVVGVQYVPGFRNTLIVQHGDYYSVYSNLENVTVEKGAAVRSGQLLGLAGTDSQDDFLEMHLEIWKGKQRLNPAVWLKR